MDWMRLPLWISVALVLIVYGLIVLPRWRGNYRAVIDELERIIPDNTRGLAMLHLGFHLEGRYHGRPVTVRYTVDRYAALLTVRTRCDARLMLDLTGVSEDPANLGQIDNQALRQRARSLLQTHAIEALVLEAHQLDARPEDEPYRLRVTTGSRYHRALDPPRVRRLVEDTAAFAGACERVAATA